MNPEELEAMAEAYKADPPKRSPRKQTGRAWHPNLGPIGMEVLRDLTPNILLHGERGSLKTGIALHKLVLAMHDNWQNLGFIFTLYRSSATEGGAWEKLHTLTLPEWFDGIGLDFTEPKMDDQKNRYCFVGNKHREWSRVVLKSMPPGTSIQAKLRGPEPGFVLFDEISEANDAAYFHKISQQLRRPHIPNPQFLGTCNPPDDGEDHWLHPLFLTSTDKTFKDYHVPITENVFWTKQYITDYQAKIILEAKADPTIIDRLIHGRWVKRPTGEGLFAESFNAMRQVKGSLMNGEGLRPIPGFPIFISYDLGPKFSCATFEQFIPTKDGRIILIVFDEVDLLGVKVLYRRMAKDVIARCQFWCESENVPFQILHVTDESAVSQWRAGGEQGSYDAWEFEREFNAAWPERRPKMKMQGAPKGKGSVSARVNLIRNKLLNDELYVSALCPNTIEMLRTLSEDKDNPGNPAKGRLIHKFDSLSYAPFKMETGGARKLLQTKKVAPSLIRCGSVTS